MTTRVLSLQSHVVSGYVGNRAAVFPLQILGFDVDFINSVQFSNHTGYCPGERPKGSVTSGEQLRELGVGLQNNGLLDYEYFLTGYIASETFLDEVLNLLRLMRSENPSIKYVCDPVCGDDGKLYIPPELVEIFKQRVIPEAYMITPNQFEAELLTGMKITTHNAAVEALLTLHALGPQIVALTSSELEDAPGKLCCYILSSSSGKGNSVTASDGVGPNKEVVITKVVIDKIKGYFTGTGDATSALLLGWNHLLAHAESIPIRILPHDHGSSNSSSSSSNSSSEGGASGHRAGEALVKTLSTMQAVITRTRENQRVKTEKALAANGAGAGEETLTGAQKSRFAELCIISSKADIESPPPLSESTSVTTWTEKIH